MAVTLMALVAVALACLTARVSTVARQAAADRERAQVEELVLAGIEAARRDPAARGVELPAALREAGGSLKVTPREGRVEIEAVVGRTRVVQEVELAGGGVKVRAPRGE
jgi:hypothetical protein